MKSWILGVLAVGFLCVGRAGAADKARADLEAALAEARDAQARVAILEELGESYQYANEMDRAEASFRAALDTGEAAWGESLQVAATMARLGNVLRLKGRQDEAAQLQERALKIRERLAPDSLEVAASLHQMFLIASERGDLEAIYRDAIELALERKRDAEAFHLLERSRARSFLVLLAERDVGSGELPEALARSLRDNAARYDRKLRELTQAGETAKEALQRDLDLLRRERERIGADIRKTSPRLAALREPLPLDLEAARKVLDPGTLALSYSVGKQRTALFALTREGGLEVKTLPVGEAELRRQVESFLEQVRSQGKPGADLYRELIAPVADLVERSERILILPDGPLHRLPFGALTRDTRGGGRFLSEWKPLHTALSLTVYGTLRASGGERPRSGLVAFGDPSFPKDMQAVVASLWSVADQVTAELMARFHRHLAAGLPKDQALRAAQLELIRAPVKITTAQGQTLEMDASAPFYWAAFELFGDWK